MAAVHSPNKTSKYSRNAGEDLSSYQYCMVEVSTSDGDLELPGANGDFVIGILQNAPEADKTGEVDTLGHSKVKLGATLVAGQRFMVEANTGKALAWTAGEYCLGHVLEGGDEDAVVHCNITHSGGTLS